MGKALVVKRAGLAFRISTLQHVSAVDVIDKLTKKLNRWLEGTIKIGGNFDQATDKGKQQTSIANKLARGAG